MKPEIWLGIGTLIISGISVIISIISQNKLNSLKRNLSLEMVYKPTVIEEINNYKKWVITGYKLIVEYVILKLSKNSPENNFNIGDQNNAITLKELNKKIFDTKEIHLSWAREFEYYQAMCKEWSRYDDKLEDTLYLFYALLNDIYRKDWDSLTSIDSEYEKLNEKLKITFKTQISLIEGLLRKFLEID